MAIKKESEIAGWLLVLLISLALIETGAQIGMKVERDRRPPESPCR